MKTIKIIDLLDKIAMGEDIPKEIEYEDRRWKRNLGHNDYEKDNGEYLFDDYLCFCEDTLNDEVKIIEKAKPTQIEKLPKSVTDNAGSSYDFRLLATKLNEVIATVNELKKGSDNNE